MKNCVGIWSRQGLSCIRAHHAQFMNLKGANKRIKDSTCVNYEQTGDQKKVSWLPCVAFYIGAHIIPNYYLKWVNRTRRYLVKNSETNKSKGVIISSALDRLWFCVYFCLFSISFLVEVNNNYYDHLRPFRTVIVSLNCRWKWFFVSANEYDCINFVDCTKTKWNRIFVKI